MSKKSANPPMRRPTARRGRGFTLIELLIVIAIIATLITVLLPAVFRVMDDVKEKKARTIISRLAFACDNYAKDYDDAPPSAVSSGNLGNLSGTQNMRLALIGYWNNGGTMMPMDQGAADVTTCQDYSQNPDAYRQAHAGLGPPLDQSHYATAIKKKYLTEYTNSEFIAPRKLQYAGGGDQNIEVVCDTEFTPVRPILYYRKWESDGAFHSADNAMYLGAPGDNAGGVGAYINRAIAGNKKYFVIWAGRDRKFFSGDDFSSLDY